jgi:adenylate cyclase
MADVFVSYARPDEPQAKRVAEALRDAGFSVWRDDQLPAHRAYADVIQERLTASKAVIVLWSADAANSQWVRAEADVGRHARTLIQASLDDTIPPIPFNQIQCASLAGWNGDATSTGWCKLLESVAELTGRQPALGKEPAQAPRQGICILPFANMSGDAEQEYFSDGISEDITTDLSKVSALDVIARNTAFTFKGESIDVCEVARSLGVSHVLEGSVRKAGSRVRISAQLIDGKTGSHVWAERYDRELTDIFAIQDEISKAIVDALKVKLLPAEKKAIEQRGTTNGDAYNLYLMARQFWISGNWGDTKQLELVSRICARAVQFDPNYARVWGLLAIVQCILHFTFNSGDQDGMEAADRALKIDPTVVEAYAVRARHLYEQGNFSGADDELAQAFRIDPESWEANREAARIYYFERRFAEAASHYEKAVSIVETDFHSWAMLSSTYGALNKESDARRAAEMAVEQAKRALSHDPTNGNALGMVGYGLAVMNERQRFKEWVERAVLINPDNMFMRYNFACITAMKLHDVDGALDLLEPIVSQFQSASIYNATLADPDLDSVRQHPRFVEMMTEAARKLGIEPPLKVAAAS